LIRHMALSDCVPTLPQGAGGLPEVYHTIRTVLSWDQKQNGPE
jgi:hypothetical protein